MWSTRILRAAAKHAGHAAHDSAEYGAFHAPHISELHRNIGRTLGAIMWFWIFYRAREDGPVVIGMRLPWEGHEHHDEEHHDEEGHHHGEGEAELH